MLYIYCIKNKKYNNGKKLVCNMLCFFVPLCILGLIQMWYNYIRFDSIFEFGAKYQLTVADMRIHMGFSLPAIIKGFAKYLFTLPKIDISEFPFTNLYNNLYYNTALNEYEYENFVSGILIIPIIWILFFKNKICTKNNVVLKKVVNIIILISIIQIFIITCFAGTSQSYSVDIKLMLVIVSVLTGLKIIEENLNTHVYDSSGYNKTSIKFKRYNSVFITLCIISVILVMPQSFSTESNLLDNMYLNININLSNFFEFWK